MKRVIHSVKIVLLLSALWILAWSALPGGAEAGAFCEGAGHSCHAVSNGTLLHLEESGATY